MMTNAIVVNGPQEGRIIETQGVDDIPEYVLWALEVELEDGGVYNLFPVSVDDEKVFVLALPGTTKEEATNLARKRK